MPLPTRVRPALASGAALALAAALTGCAAGSSTPPATPVTESPPTSASGPAPTPAAAPQAPGAPAGVAPGSAVPDEQVTVTIAGGKVHGPSRVEVARGASVRITVTSDVADELHVHGFDKEVALPADVATSVDLVADTAGLFAVETHESNLLLFQLLVR